MESIARKLPGMNSTNILQRGMTFIFDMHVTLFIPFRWTCWDPVHHYPGMHKRSHIYRWTAPAINIDASLRLAKTPSECADNFYLPLRGKHPVKQGRHYFEVKILDNRWVSKTAKVITLKPNWLIVLRNRSWRCQFPNEQSCIVWLHCKVRPLTKQCSSVQVITALAGTHMAMCTISELECRWSLPRVSSLAIALGFY
jgi:hypothetical protein